MNQENKTLASTWADVILGLIIPALINAFPFLGWPIIGPILIGVITAAFNMGFDALSEFIEFKKIDWKEDGKNQEYKNAVEDLNNAVVSGDKDAINDAKEDAKDRLRDLIKF